MRNKNHKPMSVTFIRSGERRYAVRATTADGQSVQMDPAPGFDPLMPHDLQHFIVERCLGIEGGIFGRLAAGGTAGTFHATASGSGAREASRRQRKRTAKDGRLMPSLAEDYARSERATYVCWHDWLAHADRPELRARALGMREGAAGMLARMPPRERADFVEKKLEEIRREFQRLSERWSTLAVGENFTEPW
jgi:hypothetical protein